MKSIVRKFQHKEIENPPANTDKFCAHQNSINQPADFLQKLIIFKLNLIKELALAYENHSIFSPYSAIIYGKNNLFSGKKHLETCHGSDAGRRRFKTK